MIKSIFIFLALLLSLQLSAHADKYEDDLVYEMKSLYDGLTDKMIRNWTDHGVFPSKKILMRIEAAESRILSIVEFDSSLTDRLPSRFLAEFKCKTPREVPGKFIIGRAQKAGLDLRKDCLSGRRFKQFSR